MTGQQAERKAPTRSFKRLHPCGRLALGDAKRADAVWIALMHVVESAAVRTIGSGDAFLINTLVRSVRHPDLPVWLFGQSACRACRQPFARQHSLLVVSHSLLCRSS
jgi:hypothetical protein